MQTSQELDLWLKIFGLILPTLVAIFVPIITYLLISRKLAVYQSELNKEIYGFQTRYSLLHQRKAEVIQEIYASIAIIGKNAETMVSVLEKKPVWLEMGMLSSFFEKAVLETITAVEDLAKCFTKKQILLDTETCRIIADVIAPLTDAGINISLLALNQTGQINFTDKAQKALFSESIEVLRKKTPPLKEKLEKEFKQILAAELQTYQLKKSE